MMKYFRNGSWQKLCPEELKENTLSCSMPLSTPPCHLRSSSLSGLDQPVLLLLLLSHVSLSSLSLLAWISLSCYYYYYYYCLMSHWPLSLLAWISLSCYYYYYYYCLMSHCPLSLSWPGSACPATTTTTTTVSCLTGLSLSWPGSACPTTTTTTTVSCLTVLSLSWPGSACPATTTTTVSCLTVLSLSPSLDQPVLLLLLLLLLSHVSLSSLSLSWPGSACPTTTTTTVSCLTVLSLSPSLDQPVLLLLLLSTTTTVSCLTSSLSLLAWISLSCYYYYYCLMSHSPLCFSRSEFTMFVCAGFPFHLPHSLHCSVNFLFVCLKKFQRSTDHCYLSDELSPPSSVMIHTQCLQLTLYSIAEPGDICSNE